MGDNLGWLAAVALVRGKYEAATRAAIWEDYPYRVNLLARSDVAAESEKQSEVRQMESLDLTREEL
jgi:hypothetical protein